MIPFPEPIFVPLKPEDLPKDPVGTATGWSFRTIEHDEMNSPQCIEVTDAQGRCCIYEAKEHLPQDRRPQDDALQTGAGWHFLTLHPDENGTPTELKAMDPQGRSADYMLLRIDGQAGRWM